MPDSPVDHAFSGKGMPDRTLLIVRGLPGSAKSTLARMLAPYANFTADDFYTDADGTYTFDVTRLREAHGQCENQTMEALRAGIPIVAVHNTFAQAWMVQPYFDMAAKYGYSPFIVECQNDFGNTHGVSETIIQRMREQWEPLNSPRLPLSTIVRFRLNEAWTRWRKPSRR